MNENIVLLIFFSQLLMAGFLISLKQGNIISYRLLATFLIVGVIDLSNFIFPNFYNNHMLIDMTRANISLFNAPIIYLFVRSVLHSDFKLSNKHLLHTLPFIFICIIFLPRFYLGTEQQQLSFYTQHIQTFEIQLVNIVVHSQIAIYLALSFWIRKQQQQLFRDHYSDPSQLQTHWIGYFLWMFLINYLVVLTRNIAKFFNDPLTVNLLTPFMLLVTLAFCTWLIFQSLNNPQLFKGIESEKKNKKTTRNSEHNNAEFAIQQQALETHLCKNKPYIDPSLTLEKLAQQLLMDEEQLSILLNHHMGQHFFDVVNQYRIEEAAQILKDPLQQKRTILDILYAVGFNSKSSFNTAFKKRLKTTPSTFRQLHNK